MAVLLFLLLFACLKSSSFEKIICQNETEVFLEPKKIYFIESPNFPQTMTNGCRITFISQDTSNETTIMLSITNGILERSYFGTSNNIRFINTNELPYNSQYIGTNEVQFEAVVNDSYNAFQAVAMIEYIENECPMAFFDSSSPFNFTDDSEILYLSKRYPKGGINCSWHFTAPFGYKFKVEVSPKIFNFYSKGKIVSIDNGNETKIIMNQTRTEIYNIYGKKLHLSVIAKINPQISFEYSTEFEMSISITKILHVITETDCKIFNNRSEVIWTNIDQNMGGYQNNVRCFFNLTAPWKNEIVVIPEIVNIRYPDTINFYIDNFKNEMFEYSSSPAPPYYFQSLENGTGRDIFFEFISDGNIQSQGFKLRFIERECKCRPSNIVVPCEGLRDYTIMDTEDDHFCGYLHCRFTINLDPSCAEKNAILRLSLFNENVIPSYVEIIVISDDIILLNSTKDLKTFSSLKDFRISNILLINSRNNYITFDSKYPGNYKFSIVASEPFNVLPTIILTHNQPSYIVDFNQIRSNTVFTVKIDETLASDLLQVVISVDVFLLVIFYEDENMTFLYEAIPDKILPVAIDIKVPPNKLTIYVNKFCENGACLGYFRAIKKHSEYCPFTSNVVMFPDPDNLIPFQRAAMFAKDEGECEMIFFTYYEILHLWTSSKTANVEIYAKNNKPLLSFNKQNASSWNKIYIHNKFFKVKIPADTNIVFDFAEPNDIDSDNTPGKKLWSSSQYEQFSPIPDNNEYILKVDNNSTATFKILDLNISSFATFYVNEQNVTFIGQTFEFSDTWVDLIYREPEYGYYGALIEIEMTSNN